MTFSQITAAEPWTPASVVAGLALAGLIVGVIIWRVLHSDD